MDIELLKTFLMWCTVINLGLLVLSSVVCVFAGGWVYRMHSKWFSISREAFNIAIYSFLGFFKVMWFMLNLVPYIALQILC